MIQKLNTNNKKIKQIKKLKLNKKIQKYKIFLKKFFKAQMLIRIKFKKLTYN